MLDGTIPVDAVRPGSRLPLRWKANRSVAPDLTPWRFGAIR